ncbi:uncharacterized protein MONBRDRAFT_22950 [Monosiga brevicollis MX1]|uniref:Large ribosomal subunit protein uL18m n=1 Tax=Monosiga brevicollis TaxID=81824 RepID=A9USJ9_MONBE|nr:uncharacterized protein MONBRDRAFT_22950 [Monosiga brevicollis MX1]EDQ92113.1 predicted protein [Monosiga brevicollis MX1]|eukprot:XP_001743399.1 hypothetical protein [Monosiga brevicollis MX1]
MALSGPMPSVLLAAQSRAASTAAPTHREGTINYTSTCGKFKVLNRNPRSAQLTGAVRRAGGFATSHVDVAFFYRLRLERSNKHISAAVDTPDRTIVLTATTQEYNIARHLYGYADKAAAQNLALVLAQRLHESGITKVKFDRGDAPYHGRVKLFVEMLRSQGIEFDG